ncbi:MGMT family protein [Candidatus Persebacteraceae bacterium Df01]|jgi:methylated-DNA-[protein]-cysteine S-methyltransferase|uniref:MGMT family protein n=1 Tax=Candidatus Doriopsillibacter californiensis TaxID=2970740 RepID=A0ABT7QLJ1_9GAMM|nr:MGMT family protein [Candidatus Persebacteraceae bacterium Df01]
MTAVSHNAKPRWQLKIPILECVLAVRCDEYGIIESDYLFGKTAPLPPQNALAEEAARQIKAWLRRPRGHQFDLPLHAACTPFQERVRKVLQNLAGGETQTYGDVAKYIHSAPRAVGGACRANRLPLLVPCHRVVAQDGLGGFMGDNRNHRLNIHLKQALLRHEGVTV